MSSLVVRWALSKKNVSRSGLLVSLFERVERNAAELIYHIDEDVRVDDIRKDDDDDNDNDEYGCFGDFGQRRDSIKVESVE